MADLVADAFDSVEYRCRVLNLPAWSPEAATVLEKLAFRAENLVSRGKHAYYLGLSFCTVVAAVGLGVLWFLCPENRPTTTVQDSMFMAFQIFAVGGYDSSITGPGPVVVYVLIVLTGLILVATLIGMITENFQAFIASMNEGRTKATVEHHTLILGWGETTARAVVQIALLQGAHKRRNSTWTRRICWWKRHKPSTPVAEGKIVIMTNTLSKAEMHEQLEAAFDASAVPVGNVKIGRDIICRVGDPCVHKDLQRVGAHRATCILVMMAGIDIQEKLNEDEGIRSGATTRVLLALRPLLAKPSETSKFKLRIVADIVLPNPSLQCFDMDLGSVQRRPVFRELMLTTFMNSLEFSCLHQPGLAFALQELLGFEGAAFRSRNVVDFTDGGKDLLGKTVHQMNFVWENAIFCGIVGDGLVVDADRIIRAEDRLVFISESSLPKVAKRQHDVFTIKSGLDCHPSKKEPQHVLVCGWRYEWQYTDIFVPFMSQIVGGLQKGSSLVFVFNDEIGDGEGFPELLARAAEDYPDFRVARHDGHWLIDGSVTLYFVCDDPGKYNTLEKVYKAHGFTDAVLLPTTSTWKASAQTRDTRTLSIMLGLRHLQLKHKRPPVHVVAEAAQESVRLLAVGPTYGDSGDRVKVPDFVDVHAISAAALTNAVAYPQMFGCLSGLFSFKTGTPTVSLERVDRFLEDGAYSFGALKGAAPSGVGQRCSSATATMCSLASAAPPVR